MNARTVRCLKPFKPDDSTAIVKGAVYGVTYDVVGQAILRAKCSDETIDIPVKIVKDHKPYVILGHDFLTKYGVIMDYTANEIFLGIKNRVILRWLENKKFQNNSIKSDILTDLRTG